MGPKLESEGVFKVSDELCDFSEEIRAGGMFAGAAFFRLWPACEVG